MNESLAARRGARPSPAAHPGGTSGWATRQASQRSARVTHRLTHWIHGTRARRLVRGCGAQPGAGTQGPSIKSTALDVQQERTLARPRIRREVGHFAPTGRPRSRRSRQSADAHPRRPAHTNPHPSRRAADVRTCAAQDGGEPGSTQTKSSCGSTISRRSQIRRSSRFQTPRSLALHRGDRRGCRGATALLQGGLLGAQVLHLALALEDDPLLDHE